VIARGPREKEFILVMKLLKIGPRVTERFLAKRRFCASAPGSHCWIRVDAAPSARVVASVVATPCGWSMGVMLASGITGVVPSAVVRRPTRSSPSALRLRHAACARVVPRYALATSPTVALLVRFDAIGLRRRAGVIPGAFAPGTTTPGAVRWHWWREKADVLDPKTGGPSSRGAAQTVWAASAAFTAPATDDESEKRKWIQTLLKTGPLAPGYVRWRPRRDTWYRTTETRPGEACHIPPRRYLSPTHPDHNR
jgi:hypothetical protein